MRRAQPHDRYGNLRPWIRVVGMSLLPIGWAGAVISGVSARNGPGRVWALTGLALAAVTAVALVVLVATGP